MPIDEGLRSELIGQLRADGEAVAAFLASAEEHRALFVERPEAGASVVWPYGLLEWAPAETAPATVRRLIAVVHENAERLRQIVAQYGWPGRSLVGEDGADAAWLILQHCGSGVPTVGTPDSLAFQRSCLPILEQAVLNGEAHPRHLAHVADNLLERSGEPPEFAVLASAYSVIDGRPVFNRPIDLPTINHRRAEIGLAPFAEDLRRRTLGQVLWPTGPTRVEPWPASRS
jgi:hypothetical protein